MSHGAGMSAGEYRRTQHGGNDQMQNPVSRLFEFCAANKLPSPRFDFTVDWKYPLRPLHVAKCVLWVNAMESYCSEMGATTKNEAKRLAAEAVMNTMMVDEARRHREAHSAAGDQCFSADTNAKKDERVREPAESSRPADGGSAATRTRADVAGRTAKVLKRSRRYFAARKEKAAEKKTYDLAADAFAAAAATTSQADADKNARKPPENLSSASTAAEPSSTRGATVNGEVGDPETLSSASSAAGPSSTRGATENGEVGDPDVFAATSREDADKNARKPPENQSSASTVAGPSSTRGATDNGEVGDSDVFAATSQEDAEKNARKPPETLSSASTAAGPSSTRGATENEEVGDPYAGVPFWKQTKTPAEHDDDDDDDENLYRKRKRVRQMCA